MGQASLPEGPSIKSPIHIHPSPPCKPPLRCFLPPVRSLPVGTSATPGARLLAGKGTQAHRIGKCLLATRLADGPPSPSKEIQGALASMAVMADAVRYSILPHTTGNKAGMLGMPEVHCKAFMNLNPRLQHGALQVDPLRATLADDEALQFWHGEGHHQCTQTARPVNICSKPASEGQEQLLS